MTSYPSKSPVRVRRRINSSAGDPELARAAAAFAPQVSERRLSDLKASVRNARTHSKKQVHLIAESIKAFGFVSPIVAAADGEIVAGHDRDRLAHARSALDRTESELPALSGHRGRRQPRAAARLRRV